MSDDPYAEFQKAATPTGDPYAEFSKPAGGYKGELTSTGIAAPQGTESFGSAIKTFAGDIRGMFRPSAQNPYPGEGQKQKTEAATDEAQRDAERKKAGYSKPYRVLAPVAESLGANVPGMEQAAKEGKPGDVVAHAAVVPAALATTMAVGEGLSQVGKLRKQFAPKEIPIAGENVPVLVGEATPETRQGRVQAAAKRSGAGAQDFKNFATEQQAKVKQVIRNVAQKTSGLVGPMADEPGKAVMDAADATFDRARPIYKALDESLATVPDAMSNVSKIMEQAIGRAEKLGVKITPGEGESITLDGRQFSPETDPEGWANLKRQGLVPDTSGQPISSYLKVRSQLVKMRKATADPATRFAIQNELQTMNTNIETALKGTPLWENFNEANRLWSKGYAIREVGEAIRKSTKGTPTTEQAPGMSKVPTAMRGKRLVQVFNDLADDGTLKKAFTPEETKNLRQAIDILDRASDTPGQEFGMGYGPHSTIMRNLVKIPFLPLVKAMTTIQGVEALRTGNYPAFAAVAGSSQGTHPKTPADAKQLLQQATPAAKETLPKGMVEKGNINLNGRPILHNPDGSISTEISFSLSDDPKHPGKEVLVPLIVNGKKLTQKQAWQHYLDTGEHMGIFDNPDDAEAYARKAHSRKLNASPESMLVAQ